MTERPLSYNVLKSIFDNLPLDKRIEIITHIPSVRTAERRSILQLDRFRLDELSLILNDTEYSAYEQLDSTESGREITCLEVKRNDKEVLSKEFEMQSGELLQKILDFYLADRQVLKIQHWEISHRLPISFRLPEGLKIQCRELELHNRFDPHLATIRAIRPFLIDSPLEKISIQVKEAGNPIFQEELVQTAKYLEIRKASLSRQSIVMDLSGLKCNHIHVETYQCELDEHDAVKLARMWLETCPKLGTRFTVNVIRYEYVLDVMDQLIDELGAVRGEVLEEDLKNTFFRHCVSIPMRSGHELNVFGGLHTKTMKDAKWLLRIEVMRPEASVKK